MVVCCGRAVSISLGPNVVLFSCGSVPEDDSVAGDLNSGGILTDGEISAVVSKARFNAEIRGKG